MKKLFFVLIGCLYLSTAAEAQTTFIFTRHAEKVQDGTRDPILTPQGQARAASLVTVLSHFDIAAAYATPFQRTRLTITPLAAARHLEISTYEPMKVEPIQEMLRKHVGQTIVVCGHSNTIPWTVNYLTGKKDVADFADDDYSNLLIVEVQATGQAKVYWLKL